ncbi:hypothetical protein BJX61DRAFT_545447 [Aspergillus egyptiacus]|nr:hypothetical protein BJX61DRAFT_545447 [Aspergillus egyptiacus]
MTSTSETEGNNEDVNDFLQRIRELGEKRDKEDEERTKKLEEEILQGRKERQARRAERARSISPTKDSPPLLNPLRLSMSSLSHRGIDPPEQLEPTPRTPHFDMHSPSSSFREDARKSLENSPVASKLDGSDIGTSPKASPTLRSRAGTLSWQQRPTSRDLSGHRTLLSNSPSRETRWRAMSNASTDEPGLSRSPLTALPASRDSLSLQKTEEVPSIPGKEERHVEEPKDEHIDTSKAKEPEVESRVEPGKENGQGSSDERSPPPSRASSSFADSSLGNRYSSISSVSTATGLGSPVPLSGAQKLDPPQPDGALERQISPASPKRLSPERSTSPTKGLGGFVQSAMMRRSDSVSKRWSAQLPSGHSRGNSLAGNRNSFAAPSNLDIFSTPKLSPEGPSFSSHRPTSSHSEATIVHQTKDGESPVTPPVLGGSDKADRPTLALHTRSTSSVGVATPTDFKKSMPTTPVSRTMDPKRWSPTKSSWLESALNLSESPKHKRQSSQQASRAKERQSRGSVDLGHQNNFKEVTPVGLMRTTPLGSHVKKPSLSGMPDLLGTQIPSPTKDEPPSLASPTKKEPPPDTNLAKEEPPSDSSPAKEEPQSNHSPIEEELPSDLRLAKEESPADFTPGKEEQTLDSKALKTESIQAAENKDVEDTTKSAEVKEGTEDTPTRKHLPPALSPTAKTTTDFPVLSPQKPIRDPLLSRPKPQPAVIDFRANLRKREIVKDQSSKEEPEFKNVFGKLRKAETSTYVAPDALKDNILRGKAALNQTAGPKRTQKVDDLKESILKQKETMKANGASVRRGTVGQSDAPSAALPEAILKRQNLAKSISDKKDSPTDSLPSPVPKETETPDRHSLDSFNGAERAALPQPAEESTVVDKSGSDSSSEGDSTRGASEIGTNHGIEQHAVEDAPKNEFDDSSKEASNRTAFNVGTNDGIEQHREEDEATRRTTAFDVFSKGVSDPVASQTSTIDEIDREVTEGDGRKFGQDEAHEEPKVEAIKPVRPLPSNDTVRATDAPPAKKGHVTKGSLAGRINPALADLLSRGLPAAADGLKSVSSTGGPTKEASVNRESSMPTPTLTHMTKARARGPKRRPPTAVTTTSGSADTEGQSDSPKARPSSFDAEAPSGGFSPAEPPVNTSRGWPLPDQSIDSKLTPETGFAVPSPSAPIVPNHSDDILPPVPEKDIHPLPTTPSRRPLNLERKPYDAEQEMSLSGKLAMTSTQQATSPSSTYGGQTRSSRTHYSSPSPSPLRTSLRENQTHPSPRLTGPQNFIAGSRESSPFRKSLPSPPVPPKGRSVSADQVSCSSPKSSASLVPQADESLEAISAFFKTFPRQSDRVNIDPQMMLTDKNDGLGIRTFKKQIWEITGDGKKQDLPANQEYILYEGAMYLCVHMFEDAGTPHTEVQLWCGDDVWGGAVDNALPFSRKVAREHGCKLEIVSQGKEPARFIQALGGILITRRGASSRSSSSAIFMLCGRKHLGQMVFDEVDYSPQNLCTGYPFVISAMFGKVYLWKGKGSSAEEIGAARLIGMDLGLTGEFEEVAEGEEPSSFYEVFPQHRETGDYIRSDHWLLKPAHDHFRLRLFRVDHELGQRSFWMRRPGSSSPVIRPNDTVQEVEPFSQNDLSAKGVYILDTYFEIYVIVGDQASNRPAEFASAVVFAHEYGILAASLQDRPFIPKSFISLGGPPESCRSAFRKWSQRPLQRPPQVFPLTAAIDAIRS